MSFSRVHFLALVVVLSMSITSWSQAIIQVRLITCEVLLNEDCDGFFTGDSDFVFEFTATGDALGLTNNNPSTCTLIGQGTNTVHRNGNNGPWTVNSPSGDADPSDGLFFNHDCVCVPTQINMYWTAYENDNPCDFDLGGILQEGTVTENFVIPVPGAPGTSGPITRNLTSGGGCNQSYRITFEVTRAASGTTLNYAPDNICDAIQIPVNTNIALGWCPGASLEVNEPHQNDVSNQYSRWVYFVAPASGSVEVTTDLGGTQFGTYFELYHAADGIGCIEGVQPISGTIIKNKFDYLSHIEFADGIDLLGVDPEAELDFDACDPVAPFSYQKLIPGEVYYVQLTADNANEGGRCDIQVNDLGGSAGDLEDIPCLSPTVPFGTTAISSAAGSGPTINLGFGCAYDGGNDHAETGTPHTGNNPEDYHAYDYDHPAANNGTMNESVWLNFIAPNSGRIVFETDYNSAIYSEDAAFFGYDKRFGPGTPADFHCADLENIDAIEGGLNGIFGGATESAIISQQCIEPGYTYYGMVDPANNLTFLNTQNIDAWVYDPSVDDPINNPPGNDILCLTMLDPLYEVPVTPAGLTPPFTAVAGTNERACTEYLAGEPGTHPVPADRADQTVWHYFTVPATGAIEMNIRAYIGMDTLRYSIYELLNGTDCYGGLNPATFTNDGTQLSPIITPVLQGSAGFDGTQESVCCMVPGAVFAIQLDGSYAGDEGQYIIEYIKEVESYAGDTYVATAALDTIDLNSADTAFVCFGDDLAPGNLINGIGLPTLDIPSCLQEGFVLHSTPILPDPVFGSGFTYTDTVQGSTGVFTNNTNGSGASLNPFFNTVYYVSSMADDPSAWGDFNCTTSTLDNTVLVVYLQPVVPVSSYDNLLCEMTFTASGGLAAFYGSNFSYTIQDGSMNIVQTGTFASGVNVVYPAVAAEIYTITVDDGNCPYTFTVDATACGNPCIISPIIDFVNAAICQGQSIFLEGANQTSAGIYTDIFVAANGCDSTVYTTLTILDPIAVATAITICTGSSYSIGGNTYTVAGQYVDIFVAANGCDSIVTTNLFVESEILTSVTQTICTGTNYPFGGNNLDVSGVYVDSLIAAAGCDSVVTLYLTVTPLITASTTQTICEGTSIDFGAQTLSASGTYVEMFTTVSGGCDSLVTMFLFVNQTIENPISSTICEGQSYILGTQTLTASGQYSEMFTTPTGCDSLVTLFLTVTEYLDSTIAVSICDGETYIHGTQSLTSSGLYDELFTTSGGCDSIVTLELEVLDCEGLLEISNICTPNDDGSNDTWKVSDLNQIVGCNVVIYNRWGQPIYETDDYQNEWNGTKEGEVLPDGVYYYTIGCDENRQYEGAINLMRFKK